MRLLQVLRFQAAPCLSRKLANQSHVSDWMYLRMQKDTETNKNKIKPYTNQQTYDIESGKQTQIINQQKQNQYQTHSEQHL